MQSQNIIPSNNTQYFSGATHSFDIDFARMHGLQESILMKHLLYWIAFNKRKGVNFIEGRTWMYQTQEEMGHHHPYWNRKQIMRILQSLVDQGIILAGNHNRCKQTKTQWYAINNEEMFMNIPNGTMGTDSQSTEQDSKKSFESPKMDSPSPKVDSPSPKVDNLYIGKDTKTYPKEKTATAKVEEPDQSAPQKPVLAVASFGKEGNTESKKSLPNAIKQSGAKKVIANPLPLTIDRPKESITWKDKLDQCHPLKCLDIPIHEKEWLLNHYSLPAIELSIAWVTHPTTHIKKSVIQALKWFLSNSPENRPKAPIEKEDIAEKNKKLAQYLESQTESPYYQIQVLSKRMIVEPKAGMGTVYEIPYDNENFETKTKDAMRKGGFKSRA